MPITPTPLRLAATMMSLGRAASSYRFMLPGESSRLATACTAPGDGSASMVSMIGWGTPIPVIPHDPMRPSARRRSKAGRTASTKRPREVPSYRPTASSGMIRLCRKKISTISSFIRARLSSRLFSSREGTSAAGGFPSLHFVEMRTSDGSRPLKAPPITVSASPLP